jgi:hypothetical protein
MKPQRSLLVLAAICLGFVPPFGSVQQTARGQFLDTPVAPGGPAVGEFATQRYRVGVVVTAQGGPCRGIYATLPVPDAWPEQRVKIVEEKISPEVRSVRYRELAGGVKQMVVEIPELPAGRQAQAIVTFALDRAPLTAPPVTDQFRIPAKPDKALKTFLMPSPYIETRNPKIVALAKEAGKGLDGWRKVEAIYDAVREKVEYRNGELKGAARALADGWGDCEELTCLFIAAARAEGIPARTVWVEGHCYPEFYLVDDAGNGWWFPCQAAGTRAFGAMPDRLPILQKGDNFRDPDRPGKPLRYVSEFLKGAMIEGSGAPDVQWIREGA